MTAAANPNESYDVDTMAARFGVDRLSDSVRQRFISWCVADSQDTGALDRSLLAAYKRGRFFAWLASAYAGRFSRKALIRKREVALLAFLECEGDASRRIDESCQPGFVVAWVLFVAWGAQEALAVLLSIPFFLPIQLFGDRS